MCSINLWSTTLFCPLGSVSLKFSKQTCGRWGSAKPEYHVNATFSQLLNERSTIMKNLPRISERWCLFIPCRLGPNFCHMQTYDSIVFKLHEVCWSEHLELFIRLYCRNKSRNSGFVCMSPIFLLKEHFGKWGMKMSFGTETSEPNILTFPPNKQITSLHYWRVQQRETWSPWVLNSYVYYRKCYGQM